MFIHFHWRNSMISMAISTTANCCHGSPPWARSGGILVQAWAPLGGSTGGISKRAQQLCGDIGKKYGKTWAQVIRRIRRMEMGIYYMFVYMFDIYIYIVFC